jgi:hypothetical protein
MSIRHICLVTKSAYWLHHACPHIWARLPMEMFLWNLLLHNCTKICHENRNLVHTVWGVEVLYVNLMFHYCWQHKSDIKPFCNNKQKTQCCIFIVTFSIFILLTAIFSATLQNRMKYCISIATISIFIQSTEFTKHNNIYTIDEIWCTAVWLAEVVQAEWYPKLVILHNSTT